MSSLRKQAMIRLLLCALVLIASIVFSVLLLTGTFDGDSAASDTTTSDSTDATPEENGEPTENTGDSDGAEPAEGQDATAEAEPTPEPTPDPTPANFEGLAEQPATVYAEGEQPHFTVTPDANMNLRAGPGTDFDKVAQIPAGTEVTALGTNGDESWIMVQYEGQYGWLAKEYLNAV